MPINLVGIIEIIKQQGKTMSNSIYTLNHYVPRVLSKVTNWAKDRNIIKGATPNKQFEKLVEESLELYATLNPDKNPLEVAYGFSAIAIDLHRRGRVKSAKTGASPIDDIGDCIVVLTILAEQHDLTIQQCLYHAYNDIKDRTGQMINGVFVKESDLPSTDSNEPK